MDNTVTDPEKKGGRYTKKEQEKRRLQVYVLHFEERKPAVEIAKQLNVNRNTITDDIKYLYQTFGDKLPFEDVARALERQIFQLRVQQSRLVEYLEDAENISDILKIEKSILDINRQLIQISLNMHDSKKSWVPPPKQNVIDENGIKSLVCNLILSNNNTHLDCVYTLDELMFNFIKEKTCDEQDAYGIFHAMIRIGLNQCEIKVSYGNGLPMWTNSSLTKYSLLQFAILRKYLTRDELELIQKKLKKTQMLTN